MNEEFDINNLIEESLYSDMPDNALDTNNYKSRSLARAKALRRLYYTNLRQSTESSIYTPTYMGEYTGTQSRFDEGLSVIPIMADPNYLNEQRAARQPFLEQLGKGVVHFGADIVGGVIMGAGVLVEPLDSAIKAAVGVENEYGNIIFDIGQTIAEGSKEALPIYSTGPGSSGWAVQGLSSIGSAVASLFIGTGVMGLLGKVGTVLKMTDTAMDVFNIASRVAGAAAMRLQENMQEGIGVAEDIIKQGEDLLNKKTYYENFVYPYQNKQYQETLEKLRAVNDPKAMNLPDQLPVPNLLGDYKIKNMDDVYKAAEIGYWTSQKVNAANFVFDFIQLGALSKFNKAIPSFGKIFTPSELLKAQGIQFENKYLRGLNWLLTRPALAESTEAIEEGINFIGEQEGRRAATLMLKGKTDLDDGTDFKERLKGYLGMSEFWDSAFWGFVAGIGGYYVMKGAGFNDHAEDLKQRTAEIAARQKQLNTFIPQVNAIIEGGKYTDPTTGEAEDYSTWDAEKRWEFLTTKTRQMGFDFGMSAARAGNADLLKHKKYIDDVMDRIMQQDAAKDKKSQIQQNEEEVLARKADLKKALMEGLDAGVRSYELAAKTFRYRTKDPVVMGHLINSYANVKLRLEEITKQLNKHDTKIAELSKEYYDHLANLGLNINPTEKDAFLKIVGISTAINYLNKHKQTLQETANKLKNSKSQNTEALNNLIEQIKGVDEMIKSLTDDKNKLSKDMEAFFQSMDKSLKEKNITVKDIINGNFINKGINPDLVDAVINKTILEKTREHLTKRLIDLTNDETIKRTEDAANELRNKQKENLSKAKKRYSFIEKKSKKDEKYINNLEDAVISLVGDDKALENRIEDAKKEKPHLAPFLDDLLYVMKTIGALTHANTIEELDMIRDALLNNPELLNYKDIVDNVYQTTKNRINNGDNTSTQPTAPTTTPEPSPAPTPTASNQSNQGQNTQNELFESNPELANAVYEALGFGQENNTEAKKADIERRRQEELDNLFSRTQASTDKLLNTPVQKLSKEEVSKNIETAKQQNKDLIEELENPEFLNDEKRNDEWDKKAKELEDKLPQGVSFRITNGKVDLFDNQSYREKGFGKKIVQVSVSNLHRQTEKFEIGDNLQIHDGVRAIPAIVTKVNEHGKILEAKDEDGKIIISRGNIITLAPINARLKINAKYDAELKALEQPNSELEAKKADIERRRQERRGDALEKIGVSKVGYDGKQRQDWKDAKNQDLKIATNHAIERLSKNPNVKIGSLPSSYSNAIKAELEIHGVNSNDKTPISEIIEKLKEINAKYDAELKAIEAQITPQQKQQAQQLYSSYLQTTNNPTIEGFKQWNNRRQQVNKLFESNPELANAVYEALGLNIINESEITYTDEEGNPCAKMGLTNTVKGTDWKIVKDFEGKPKHSNGGVDITISDKGVTIRRGGKDIKAKYGLLIINNN